MLKLGERPGYLNILLVLQWFLSNKFRTQCCFSKCDWWPVIISLIWEFVVTGKVSGPTWGLAHQNLYFNKVPMCFVYMVMVEKVWRGLWWPWLMLGAVLRSSKNSCPLWLFWLPLYYDNNSIIHLWYGGTSSLRGPRAHPAGGRSGIETHAYVT